MPRIEEKKAAKVLHASKEASDHDLADKSKSKAPPKEFDGGTTHHVQVFSYIQQ